jgi:HD-like signal output (HDOD) protein
MALPETQPSASPAPKRILFVSNDPEECAHAQRGLEDMRPKWEVACYQDAAGAAAQVRLQSFDAAVVDVMMAEGAGTKLLRDILEISPMTLRLGLSTGAERSALQQAGAPAHQFLSKPCDMKVLKAVLARAFASQDFVSQDALKRLIAGSTSLPVLPQIYNELMQELKSEEPSLERAGEIVARDMGLSAKILALVNSAFFGIGHSVAHPSEAATFLGTETLKALVLSLQVFAQFQHLKMTEFNVELLWKHSWSTGVLAKRLCEYEESPRATRDEAFIAGLLHDVGRLVMAVNFPALVEETIRKSRTEKKLLWELEYFTWGASHAELGGYLLSLWGLSDGVVEAVAFHHRPSQARRQAFSAVTAVHVANTFGRHQHSECGLTAQPIDVDYLRGLGLAERVDGWKQCIRDACAKRQ